MSPDDLKPCAVLFSKLVVPAADAKPFYDMLSDALIWTDELPARPANEWWSIRPVLRHRTCVILGEPSEFGAWWEMARQLFPGWVGFDPDRCQPTEELRALYKVAQEKAAKSLDRYFSKPPPR